MVKRPVRAGFSRFFWPTALCLLLALPAHAATWQWSSQPGRERVEVRLDAGTREQSTARTSPTSLDIQLNAAAGGVTGQGAAPASGSLIERVEPVGNALRLHLREPAFGYIVQRGSSTVTIEVFPDQLGARWQPSDARVLPPVPPAPSPASPAPAASQAQRAPQAATPGQTQPGQTQPGQTQTTQAPQAAQASQAPTQTSLPPAGQASPPAAATRQAPQAVPGTGTPPRAAPGTGGQAQIAAAGAAPQSAAAQQATPQQTPSAPGSTAPGRAPGPTAAPERVSAAQGQPQGGTGVQGATGPAAPANGGQQVVVQAAAPNAQPSAGGAGGNISVNVNVTPAGMPGAEASSGPIAVASGSSLPVQADPPNAAGPSNAVLGAITRKIEGLPQQAGSTTDGAPQSTVMLSAPAAPPAAAPSVQVQVQTTQAQPVPATQGQPGASAAKQPATAAPKGRTPDTAAKAPASTPAAAPGSGSPQAATAEAAPTPAQNRLLPGSGTGLRARYNTGGPDGWPESESLSSPSPKEEAKAATSGKVTGAVQVPAAGEKKDAPGAPAGKEEKKGGHGAPEGKDKAEPAVIYVDEKGNPVPKPLDINATLAEARKLLQSLQFAPARDMLMQIKSAPMPPEKREEMLYLLSDAITGVYNGKWLEGYEPIVASTSEAMNSNLRSPQVARALERLGMINLRTGNQQDAAGYFGVLRSKFPMDPQVAECYYALGTDQLKQGQYAEAVQSFQLVMQEYPESQPVRNSARFMAEALYKQGHYERAMTIIDFVDRRWPRIYISDPSYLLMVADTQFRRGRLEDALQTYWIYYNLVPSGPNNDQLMLNVGTIYLMQGDMESARTMYAELLKRYPDSQYAPLAVLRQGEEGIFEGNLSIDALFAMFNRPNLTTLPEVAYSRLMQNYPKSDEAVTASLRLAAWRLWNRDYSDAMDQAEAFIRDNPGSPLTPRADEIILRAFGVELAMDLEEENYERILRRWERFPQIRGAYAQLSDDLRVALARAQLNRGNEQDGFAMLQPFLERPQDPKFSDYVYKLNLAKALRTEDWQGILDLGSKVENWKLPDEERNQLVYAMAIARENLGQGQEAVPLWSKLYKRDDIPLYQKAYATYFMARDAERRRSIEDAYQLNKDSLEQFTRLGVESPDRADPARVRESLVALMDVTEVANRFAEALEWADQYAPFVPESSPDYAAFRFRLARLHRKMGDLARWQYMLEDIIKREPDSVFGRMAASELRTQAVARDLSRYQPSSGAPSSEANP